MPQVVHYSRWQRSTGNSVEEGKRIMRLTPKHGTAR